jgi:protein-L-isoaspartate(D-aspartate) O-methyltransferase
MSEFNIEQARINMIEQQIRPWDVLDQSVLDVMATTPRELFVPERHRNLAFVDMEIPLGHAQVMMSPKVEGRMLQALEIKSTDTVLEIGTGSGFTATCMAQLGQRIHTVEIYEDFAATAQARFAALGLLNVSQSTGDASQGWNDDQLYDVIAVTGSVPDYQSKFEQSLAVGGRLFLIVGEAPVMEAMLILRVGDNEVLRSKLFETQLPPLVNAVKKPEFIL